MKIYNYSKNNVHHKLHVYGSVHLNSNKRFIKVYVFELPRRKLSKVLRMLNNYLLREALPWWIAVFIRDNLVRFRNLSGLSKSHSCEYSSSKE